jgi:hypothetical protein
MNHLAELLGMTRTLPGRDPGRYLWLEDAEGAPVIAVEVLWVPDTVIARFPIVTLRRGVNRMGSLGYQWAPVADLGGWWVEVQPVRR